MRIAVVGWDLGHNAFGRTYVLADMLAGSHDVEIVGSHFPDFGPDLWLPLRREVADHPRLSVRRYPGSTFPEYFETMERMAADIAADVVYAVKPRLPSLGVGLLARSAGSRALVVDCDDLELSFVAASRGLAPGELTRLERHPGFARPDGKIWTRFSDWAVNLADAVTVASVPLAARYRGSVIAHARDEQVFDPDRYDPEAARARLGLRPGDRGILFAGTPRRHKGIHRLAAALDCIGDRRNRLLVLATRELAEVKPLLAGLERWVQPVVPPPFSSLPQVLRGADLVCVGQDPTSESAQWQMPAKVTDALAMGVPCLATPTPSLLPLIDDGGIAGAEDRDLVTQLESFLDDPGARAEQGRRGRDLFLRRFSYAAVRPRLERVVQSAVDGAGEPSADLQSAVSYQRRVFTSPASVVAANGAGGSHHAGDDPAAEEVNQVHKAVEWALPAGAGPIAVVSRGDEELIHFDDHVGWHFPQSGDGAYAGYYPGDSDAAIEQLENVRRRGARYLLIPSSSSWWLDHYAGFRDYLHTTYRPLDAGEGVHVLVELQADCSGGSR